jgi:hypothetical protein
MRTIFCVFASSLVVACASEPTKIAGQTEQTANDTVCTREYPTGSNIPMTKCRSPEQVEKERRIGQETIRRKTPGPAQTGKPGGS